jgi:DNA recombination protein RmuC
MTQGIELVVLAGLAAGFAAWLTVWLTTRSARGENAALRQEMQTLVATQAQATSAQVSQMSQAMTSQLGQLAQQVQSGMAAAGAAASGAQKAVADQLHASTEMMGTIRQQLGHVQEAGRELSDAARQIENVLGGAKSRGLLGEAALERLLSDALPPSSFQMQYRFSTGEAVDAVVRLQDRLLPVDSKFPLDDYRRLVESGEEARKDFASRVRAHADSIARKYILPSEGTLEFALMFVPSEGVYYELLRSTDSKGMLLDEYCRSKKVVPVSPATLYSHLQIICLGLRGMQIEENARRLQASLSGLQKQLENFGDVYEKLGTHLRNAQQSYTDADAKLDRARNTLDALAEGAPSPSERILEASSSTGR